ncbi:class I SAM-dependent methyltransferase [Sutcliffiella horikoshii]|nr:class I SAM-dependent methyltransferase [Sutcliffiella horikoshii]
MEKKQEFYDEVYLKGGSGGNYHKHYSESIYFPIWKKAVEQLRSRVSTPNILDLGCGVGQFANYLFDEGFYLYRGIDFSKEGILLAQKVNDKYRNYFRCENLYDTNYLRTGNYNVVFMLEVLEHLDKDIEIIHKIKRNAKVYFSVPNFNSQGHVRVFKNEKAILDRYKDYFIFDNIFTFNLGKSNKIFLCESTRR